MFREIRRWRFAAGVLVAFMFFESAPLAAATYLPICDAELLSRSPVVVHARVLSRANRVEHGPKHAVPVTVYRLTPLEVVKGKVPTREIRLVLPGGVVDGRAYSLPGTPSLAEGEEVLLFAAPRPGRPGEFGLTEFALSVFDILEDDTGTRFAVRSLFQSGIETVLSGEEDRDAPPDGARPLDPFLTALRAATSGGRMPEVARSAPSGSLRLPGSSRDALWVNLGGPEPGNCGGIPCLFRWFWDTGASPPAHVVANGTQSNLSDGSNGIVHVQNAAAGWAGVPSSSVAISYAASASSGVITVNLDVDNTSAWSTPFCGGGVLGLGGPGTSTGPRAFKGTGNYYAPSSGTVWMRHSSCAYSAALFRTAVLHEVGHTLGLGHPDQGQSRFSTTTSTDWNAAVMRSSIPATRPDTPQTDDIAAIQYYYGSGGGGSPPTSFYTLAPCRAVDTRNPAGPLGGPSLAAASARAFALAGTCGIPADAAAVSMNVTVSDATADGNIRIFPGSGPPTGTNTLSFSTGSNRANAVVMGLLNGTLSVQNGQVSGLVNVILDVNGYFR